MTRIYCLLCASVLTLSGCNQAPEQLESSDKPIAQKIEKPFATVAAPKAIIEPKAVPVSEATPGAKRNPPVKSKTLKILPAFDPKKFHVAHTLELPYYSDSINSFIFSPDGKTVAGVGSGWLISKNVRTEGAGIVFVFDVATGASLKRLTVEATPEGGGPRFNRAVWSPHGKFIAAWLSDNGIGAPLCVWEVASGKRTAVFRNEKMEVTDAAWMRDGSLLIARYEQTNSFSVNGQLMIGNGQTGKIKSIFDLGTQTVMSIHVPRKGDPQLLVLKSVGPAQADREPDAQSLICTFNAGVLSQPLFQSKPREVYFDAAWSKDGRVALCGIEQSADLGAALYAVGDLKTGKTVWQNKRSVHEVSLEIELSPDEKQAFTRVRYPTRRVILDMLNGATLPLSPIDYPFFSPDGKKIVRPLDWAVIRAGKLLPAGQKPHLKIAQIWER